MKKKLISITGRLGKDPVLYMRNTKHGRKPVAKFSLAAVVLGKDEPKTIWWQVSAWEKRADLCARNLKKGDPVQLHGFGSHGSYTNKQGVEVDTLEFNCVYVTFLAKKTEVAAMQHGVSDQETFPGATQCYIDPF